MKIYLIKIVTYIWFKFYLKSDEFHHSLDYRHFNTEIESELFITARELAHKLDDSKFWYNRYVEAISGIYSYKEIFMLFQIMFGFKGQTVEDYLKGIKNGK